MRSAHILAIMKIIKAFFITSLTMMPIYSQATEVSLQGVFLLQPEYVLEGLVPDTGTLVDFIKKEEKLFRDILSQEKLLPTAGYMVLAVRSKSEVNVWFDMQPALPKALEEKLRHEIKNSVGIIVNGGTVIVPVSLSINGASATKNMPMPKEWRDATKGESIEAEALVNLVWK